MTLTIDTQPVDPRTLEWREVRKKPLQVHAIEMQSPFAIDTLEGRSVGKAGDYLMRGVLGELYPVRREIFQESHEFI